MTYRTINKPYLKYTTIFAIIYSALSIPPLMLTRLGSSSISLMLARATTENASLISNIEMSSLVSEQISSTLLMAATGAVGKSMGANAASANPVVCVCVCAQLFVRWVITNYKFYNMHFMYQTTDS